MSVPAVSAAQWWRAAALGRLFASLATRASFLAVAWMLLTSSASFGQVAMFAGGQAAAYLLGITLALRLTGSADGSARTLPMAVGANLVSAIMLSGLSFVHNGGTLLMAIGVLVVGVARAIGDHTHDLLVPANPEVDDPAGVPPRELVTRSLVFLGSAALAAITTVLGAVGGLWMTALLACAAAVVVVWRAAGAPEGVRQAGATTNTGVGEPSSRQPLGFVALWEESTVRRFATVLFGATIVGQAGAVLAVVSWQRDAFALSDDSVQLGGGHGLLAGAFITGLVCGGLLTAGLVSRPARLAMVAAGYLVGGGAVAVASGIVPAMLLTVVAAVVAGGALATVTPVAGMLVSDRIPARLRGVVGAGLAAVSVVGVPVGTTIGAWLIGRFSPGVTALAVAGIFLTAMLLPVFAARIWFPQAAAGAVAVVSGPAKLPSRISVTLAYTDGQWLVEVRRGRALLGTRHPVKSAEAMSLLALLDVPDVHAGVEDALTTDRAEASRQVERMRAELAELEAKLTGLTEMVEQTDTRAGQPGGVVSSPQPG